MKKAKKREKVRTKGKETPNQKEKESHKKIWVRGGMQAECSEADAEPGAGMLECGSDSDTGSATI